MGQGGGQQRGCGKGFTVLWAECGVAVLDGSLQLVDCLQVQSQRIVALAQ